MRAGLFNYRVNFPMEPSYTVNAFMGIVLFRYLLSQ